MISQKEFSQNLINDIVDLFDEPPDKGVIEGIYSCIFSFVQNYNITLYTNESMSSIINRDETIINKPKKEKKLKPEKKTKKSKKTENDEDTDDKSVEVEEPVKKPKKTKKSDEVEEEELVEKPKKTKKSSKIEEESEVDNKKSTKFKKTDGFVLFSTKNKDKLKGSGKLKKLQEMWEELTDGEREQFELDAS